LKFYSKEKNKMLGVKLMPKAWRGAPEWKLEVWSQGSVVSYFLNVKLLNKTWNTSFWELATFFLTWNLEDAKNRKESHKKA
jgi:hypothetical protein